MSSPQRKKKAARATFNQPEQVVDDPEDSVNYSNPHGGVDEDVFAEEKKKLLPGKKKKKKGNEEDEEQVFDYVTPYLKSDEMLKKTLTIPRLIIFIVLLAGLLYGHYAETSGKQDKITVRKHKEDANASDDTAELCIFKDGLLEKMKDGAAVKIATYAQDLMKVIDEKTKKALLDRFEKKIEKEPYDERVKKPAEAYFKGGDGDAYGQSKKALYEEVLSVLEHFESRVENGNGKKVHEDVETFVNAVKGRMKQLMTVPVLQGGTNDAGEPLPPKQAVCSEMDLDQYVKVLTGDILAYLQQKGFTQVGRYSVSNKLIALYREMEKKRLTGEKDTAAKKVQEFADSIFFFQHGNKTWEQVIVALGILFMIVLMIEGIPCEQCLVGMALLFHYCNIISTESLFSGFMTKSTHLYAALFGISAIFNETAVLEKLLGRAMGVPETFGKMIISLCFVCILSAWCPNGPVCAMMIPLIVSISDRSGVSPAYYLMALSFSASLGGNLTMVGSSPNLKAMESLGKKQPQCHQLMRKLLQKPNATEEELDGYCQFIVLEPGFCVIGLCNMLLGLPVLLFTMNSCKAEVEGKNENNNKEAPKTTTELVKSSNEKKKTPSTKYSVTFVITSAAADVLGSTPDDCVFTKLKGVKISMVNGIPLTASKEDVRDVIRANDLITLEVGAAQVASLRRQIIGIEPASSYLTYMGRMRRIRMLYEVAIHPDVKVSYDSSGSGVMNEEHDDNPDVITEKNFFDAHKGVILGINRDKNTILVEAKDSFLKEKATHPHFLMIKGLGNSAPPRSTTFVDNMRGVAILSAFGLVLLLAVIGGFLPKREGVLALPNSFNTFEKDMHAWFYYICFAGIMFRAIDWKRFLSSQNGSVLLVFALADPIADALQGSGLAALVAGALAGLRLEILLVVLYAIAAALTQFLNNMAVYTIMSELIFPLILTYGNGMDTKVPPKPLLTLVVFAAGASYMTPVATASNMLVQPEGGYGFNSFLKPGGLMVLKDMIVTCTGVYIWIQYCGPSGPIDKSIG